MPKKNALAKKHGRKVLKRSTKPRFKSEIPIKALEKNIHQCPLVCQDNGYSFDYTFIGSCSVKTCQYFTHRTDRKCLKLDIKMPSKDFTDAEMFYYKISKNPDFPESEKPKPRTVNLLRKKNALSIKANIIFYYYVEFVNDNYKPEDSDFVYKHGVNTALDTMLSSIPFVQPELEHFKEWQLPHIFNPDVYKRFHEEHSSLLTNSSDINLNTVLGLTPVKFSKIHKVIDGLCDPEYQNMLSNTLL